MADRDNEEYKSLKFYADNTKPKKSGFSKFQVGDRYYFCRYVDGDIAMISQAYTGKPGRDNGIESVKKNEKIASRYKFEARGKSKQGFGLRAGNGQEIAISPDFATLGKAQSVASRMSGKSFAGKTTTKKAPKKAPKKAATKNPVAKKALAQKTRGKKVQTKRAPVRKRPARKVAAKKTPVKAARFTAKDNRIENYRPLSFYQKNGSMRKGFNSFEKNGAYYFHYVENGKIVLISESYTSKRGRDNGISSVMKNMGLKSAYKFHQHKNGKHYFDLNATNGQEIATSRWYSTKTNSRNGAAYLNGEKTRTAVKSKKTRVKTTRVKSTSAKSSSVKSSAAKSAKAKTVRSASEEQNYQPLAFYRKHTKGKKKGFEKFKGGDGEYYFTYFENSKLALISEGYPTAAIRDKGVASVQKNIKLQKRYVQGTGADGKPGFILRAGNHKEIARSVGYGSAAAAVTGAAYLMGTRRRPAAKPKAAKPKLTKVKKTVVKKAAAPVKAAAKPKPKPKPKAKPKVKPRPKVKPLAAGTVAVAGLAGVAAAKANEVKKAAVPVKAAPIKAAPPPPPPVAPIKAAPIAATAAPVQAAPVAAAVAPVAAAAAIPAAAAPAAGAGIWGWLKWLLLLLLALLAIFFLFKACAGGAKEAKVAAPVTTQSPAPAALFTCWNGSKTKNDAACPEKVTCWDDSFATSLSACPVRPVERNFDCWDGSKAVDLAGCPVKPAPKVTVAPEPKTPAETAIVTPAPKISTSNIAGRFCAPSSNPLFNVSGVSPKNVTRLGTNVEFGNSLSLTPAQFFNRLQNRYNSSSYDKTYLDLLARSLGYGSFKNMDASMFTNETLSNGTSGLLGFGQQHAVQYSTFNMTDPRHLEAFRVRSANGTDVHFMKRCGNYMYVCQP